MGDEALDVELWTEEERDVFRFRAGGREVRGDPLAIDRRLFRAARDAGEDIDNLLGLIRGPAPPPGVEPPPPSPEEIALRYEAVGRLLPIVRAGFGVRAIEEDEAGFTEAQTVGLLDRYLGWKVALQKKRSASPDGSPATAGPPAASGEGESGASPT
jgi:hypothetical protein